MRVLITGATGFIGRRLAMHLCQKGIEVYFLSIFKDSQIPNCKAFYWNPEEELFDSACLEGVDVLVHLAGSSISGSWSAKGKQQILHSRINTSAFLVAQLNQRTHSIKHFVGASAIGIYANSTDVQSEEQFEKATNFLGEVVTQWENASDQFASCGLTVCKIRIGLVLDKKEGALPKLANIVSNNVGSVIGSGKQYYAWIHIDDLIGCFTLAITNQLTGVYNGVAPHPVTNSEFMTTLAQALGKRLWLPAVPSWLIKLVLGEKAQLILEGQNVSNSKIEKQGYQFKYVTLEQALKQIYS